MKKSDTTKKTAARSSSRAKPKPAQKPKRAVKRTTRSSTKRTKAAKIDPRNVRRTIRALEVYLSTGQKFSAAGKTEPLPFAVRRLGLTLPGAASIPAADSNHARMASNSGRRIVEMAWEDLKPSDILTAKSFDNARLWKLAISRSLTVLPSARVSISNRSTCSGARAPASSSP